jgi:lipopolysaccharide transport system ATP-binding protein
MSSNTVAISVRGLGKKYAIAHNSTRSTSLREALMRRLLHPFGDGQQERETFWALRDVSFEIRPGEVVGIIGRNGAGKSTLLKLLSRITGPTTGTIDIHGHVASLLEVGTGFHPELTGRENIYLNASILGMSRREIGRKLDEIVAFAEIEKFLDTPVKRYSSGMYVRLAFSVAAHLEPEILILDEVLAVGDTNFQKKCLAKLDSVHDQGRTILLVSHQIQVIQTTASRAILLDKGKIIGHGDTASVIAQYLGASRHTIDLRSMQQRGSGEGRFEKIQFVDSNGTEVNEIFKGADLKIRQAVRVNKPIRDVNLAIALRNHDGIELFSPNWTDSQPPIDILYPGEHHFELMLPTRFLRPGPHWLTLCLAKNEADTVAILEGLELPLILPHPDSNQIIEGRRLGVVEIPCLWERHLPPDPRRPTRSQVAGLPTQIFKRINHA